MLMRLAFIYFFFGLRRRERRVDRRRSREFERPQWR
jgi:hypothetical protein